jgi:alanyl-tRNA synthetase
MGNKKDNFWEMGDTGPCGPCTEIHFDSRPNANNDGHSLVNNDESGTVMEIWNNVFIQFNRLKDGTLESLPAKHVDTGMGLERLTKVVQGKLSNYDTDVFTPIISEISKFSGYLYGNTRSINERNANIAMRVIADHIRAVSFCIADGQLPSNTGAGYVVRRILRRAVRYGYSYLDLKEPFFYKLIPVLANQLGSVFPEILKQSEFVTNVIKEEENSFYRTLSLGIRRFNNYATPADSPNTGSYIADKGDSEEVKNKYISTQREYFPYRIKKEVSGKFAFELFDTYGFPFDLTNLLAKEVGWTVIESEFEKEMQQQKNRSRAATAVDTEDWIVLDDYARNEFIGYDELESQTKVVKYRKVKAKGKEGYQVVLEVTPFYAESGGQVGDTGELIINNEKLKITDTKKDNDLIIHFTDSIPSDLNGEVIAKVDALKRQHTELHHSATHLVHAALRKVLGTHVAQKGSLVNEEHLRFDFSHFAKVTDEEIATVETLVNKKIRENIPVVIKEMPKDEAMKLGAMALFGEKYGDIVRVVIIDPTYSVELCGGTHVGSTGELGLFKITHETAVAAGVRRIEAVCGEAAENYVNEAFTSIRTISTTLKNPKDIIKSIENLQTENAELKKKLEKFESRQLIALRNELLTQVQNEGFILFIGAKVEINSMDGLKKLCQELLNELSKSQTEGACIVLCSSIENKAAVALGIDQLLVQSKQLDAGKIIKEVVAPIIKGGGGGQKTLATAGGQDASNLQKVIDAIKNLIK